MGNSWSAGMAVLPSVTLRMVSQSPAARFHTARHSSRQPAPSSSAARVWEAASSRSSPRSTAQAARVAPVPAAAVRPQSLLASSGVSSRVGLTRKYSPARICREASGSSQSHLHRPRRRSPRAGSALSSRTIAQAAAFPPEPDRDSARSHWPKCWKSPVWSSSVSSADRNSPAARPAFFAFIG